MEVYFIEYCALGCYNYGVCENDSGGFKSVTEPGALPVLGCLLPAAEGLFSF